MKKLSNKIGEEHIKNLIRWRIKTRKFQQESIYSCLPGKSTPTVNNRNFSNSVWNVIYFIALNYYSSELLTASDIFLGTGLPKRTVIRILDRLESLNVIKKTVDGNDRRVTRIGFTAIFAKKIDKHFQDSLANRINH